MVLDRSDSALGHPLNLRTKSTPDNQKAKQWVSTRMDTIGYANKEKGGKETGKGERVKKKKKIE